MDLQAKINWIKAELNTVTDPDLISAFMSLLQYRNKQSEEFDPELQQKLLQSLEKSEEDIKAGRVYTSDEARERLAKRFSS